MPTGTALYIRKISKRRHGSPKAFAALCKKNKLGWIALGGVWQDKHNGKLRNRWMNSVSTLNAYATALLDEGVQVWLWGYPWQGGEAEFVELMTTPTFSSRILIDPELGSNPTRSKRGPGKTRANAHAKKLVRLFSEANVSELGLSTYGSGVRLRWFPFHEFTKALVQYFGGRSFVGGQTYTDDRVIDRSISDMGDAIIKAGGTIAMPSYAALSTDVAIVPNFGLYSWRTPTGRRARGAKVRRKTPAELRSHLLEFVNEDEPVHAVIGWAENFADKKLWAELARFADLMNRGACEL